MDWIALAVLGLIWAILLVPASGRRVPTSPVRSAMPVEQDEFRQPGRWILSPRRGSRFLGRRARERQRAQERRRRVYVFLLEIIGITGLIGLFPPLRGMLVVTGFFAVLLAGYTGLVIWFTGSRRPVAIPEAHSAAVDTPRPANVLVLPEVARPHPSLEEQERRLVRIAR